ncbi:MAG: hypothetical protein COB02_10165 [Candidatus Cloacimonadota bacterium]|nr:MAG: hypothetical protein COB02_10165 [Candidatus Cloacimonadota bacterium]
MSNTIIKLFVCGLIFLNLSYAKDWTADIIYAEKIEGSNITDIDDSLFYTGSNQKVLMSEKERYSIDEIFVISKKESKETVLVSWRDDGRGRYLVFELFEVFNKSPYFKKLDLPKEFSESMPSGDFTFDSQEKKVKISFVLSSVFQTTSGVRKTLSFSVSDSKLVKNDSEIGKPKTSYDYFNLADYQRENNKPKESIKNFSKGLKKVKSEKQKIDSFMLADINLRFAKAYIENQEIDKAKKLLRDIANNFSEIGLGRQASKLLKTI